MTTQRFDIEVRDLVAKSIRTELLGIGKAAVSTFANLKQMKAELASLSSSSRANQTATAANTKAMKDQAAASRAAASAMAAERQEADRVTEALKRQAAAARDLASARGAGGGAPASPAPSPASPRTGGAGAGAYNFGGGAAYVRGIGDQAQISSQHLANLSFQLNDIFVSLASGQKPLTVFIQQGAQIGQIMTQAGVGLGALTMAGLQMLGMLKTTTAATEAQTLATARARAMNIEAAVATVASNIAAAETEIALATAEAQVATSASAAAAATARLTAANIALAESNAAATVTAQAQATAQAELAAAQTGASAATATRLTSLGRATVVTAVAMAALAAGVSLLNSEINKTTSADELTKNLGLTKEEMKELEDVTVTWGDTALAVFQVVGDLIWSAVGEGVTTAWNWMKEWAAWIGSGMKNAINFMIGGFVGAYRAIIAVWEQFPAALGDIMLTGVNAAIDAINDLVSAGIDGLNNFLTAANTVLPEFAQLPELSAPQIDRVANQWAGAGRKFQQRFESEIKSAQTVDYLGNAYGAVVDAVGARATENARNRLQEQADEIIEGRTGGGAGRGRSGKSEQEKRAESMAKVNRELDAQLALMAFYGPALERETQFLTIRNSLADKGIKLSELEEKAIRSKIAAIQEGERVQDALIRIEEDANGPRRDYVAILKALDIALKDNVISEAEATRQRNLATTAFVDGLDPLRAYREEIERQTEDLNLYGQALRDAQRARELFDRDLAAGVISREDTSPDDYLGQASQEREREQMNRAFERIDPRENEDPGSNDYILDHAKEMYAELARLREEDVISEEEAQRRKVLLDRAHLDARLERTGTILGQISQLQSSKNKELAALGKAAAIAQATIDGYRAVQAALAGPPGPPWSFAIAAATGVAAAANVAKIAGVGFMVGGYTGPGANNRPVGTVHANEFVMDAQATRRIGVPALEAMRAGALAPANDNRGSTGANIRIVQGPGTYTEVRERSDGEIEVIAERAARRVAPDAVAKDVKANPNGPVAKGFGSAYGLKRADR